MSGRAEITSDSAGRGRIKLLVAVQLLSGLFYLGCVPFLLYLTTTPQVRGGHDPAGATYGLRVGAIVCGMLAVATLTAALGLRKYKVWAYRLGAAVAWLMIASLAFGLMDDGAVDWEMLWIMLPYLAMGIFFLLPGTRLQMRTQR